MPLRPLTIGPKDLMHPNATNTWQSLDALEQTAADIRSTRNLPSMGVKLQMRIAMEHCDLGARSAVGLTRCLAGGLFFAVELAVDSDLWRGCTA